MVMAARTGSSFFSILDPLRRGTTTFVAVLESVFKTGDLAPLVSIVAAAVAGYAVSFLVLPNDELLDLIIVVLALLAAVVLADSVLAVMVLRKWVLYF